MPQVKDYDTRQIDYQTLRTFCEKLLTAAGLREEDAKRASQMLVATNLRGTDSHGVARLPHYLRRIQHGSINAKPNLRLESLGPAAARVDGDHGLGHLVMYKATHAAINLARNAGAGWVSVQNSSHCGALASYGLEIADAGMIGLVFTHVDPMVLPFGAARAFCGTNPICITAPRAPSGADDLATGALCLDMATSKVPWNTVANAAMEGAPIERGWAVDADGNDTTDARQVASLYPMGEYKGSGLGLMIDVLCAMLGSTPFGPNIPKMYGDPTERRRLGGLVGAIDIQRFVPLQQFHTRITTLLEQWCVLPPVHTGEKVLFPGQPELLEQQRRLCEGIPLGIQLLRELDEWASFYRVNNTLTAMQSPPQMA